MKMEMGELTTTLDIETYADLLRVRALPEWRMTGPRTVLTETRHLDSIGVELPERLRMVWEPSDFLFDYQQWLVHMAVDRERFAIFSTTGTGKTACLLDWSRIVTKLHGGRTLIVSPANIVTQTIDEAAKFYSDSLRVENLYERADLERWFREGSGIGITNYEKLDGTTEPLSVQAVVLDECFAPGTMVDTTAGRKRIEDVRIGDKIYNAAGIDTVSDVHCREVPYAVRVTVGGERIVCSPNHPFFTQRGWVTAQDLRPIDSLLATTEAVRMVRQVVPKEDSESSQDGEILRSVLLSEMAYESAGASSEGSYSGSCCEENRVAEALACVGVSGSASRDRTNSSSQSVASSRSTGEDIHCLETDEPQTFRAWGEWSWLDRATAEAAGCSWTELAGGIRFIAGSTNTGLSDMLQVGSGVARTENRNRGGWIHARQSESPGFQEGREMRFTRLDGVEILEPEHPDLAGCRNAEGKLRFYDLGGTRHPSFSVSGYLVHNSSVLKQSMGSRRTSIIAAFRGVRFKLCCSATPAPNDRIEYAEHAYFLDVVRSTREFLANFFVNRDGQWQLKTHGIETFYRHLASWSVFMRSPASYGFKDNTTDLPPLEVTYPKVELTAEQREAAQQWESGNQPSLFGATPGGITSRTKVQQIAHGFELDSGKVKARYPTLKPAFIASLVNEKHPDEQVIVWVKFDEEGDQLARLIPDSVHMSGKTSRKVRDQTIESFRKGGNPRVLILKASMFGHGLNLQACTVQVFSNLDDSFERWFQAVRRSHRFGQTKPVRVYIPLTILDDAICRNVMSKEAVWEADAERMEEAFIAVLRPKDTSERRIFVTEPQPEMDRAEGESWTMIQGDSVAHMATMAADSMDLAVFSPPFANLFTYSSAAADMGNVRSDNEYRLQWEFFVPELFRVMKPGRVVCIDCMDVIRFAGQHGYRYTYDYPSDLRAAMERAGFIYTARIALDTNPQTQAVRTKDQNLLFVTLKRDALDSHSQASRCILRFRKPGEPEVPVIASDVSNTEWIEYAHHVWRDWSETKVLNTVLAKEHDDERHICPLSLDLIDRCVRLWTNKGETVFSPFAGIGSEGFGALSRDRKFYGVELKRSYFETACRFLAEKEEAKSTQLTLL